jgi:hypothetical protein
MAMREPQWRRRCQIGSVLLGPPPLGYVAEDFGIRWSFGVELTLVILGIVCAGAPGTKPLKHEVE